MTISHTPGPWTLDAPICKAVVTETYHIIFAGHGFLDRKTMQGFSVTGHMTFADARLITAAPELLEALKKIITDGDYTAPEEMKRIARAAIAKVEGDTP